MSNDVIHITGRLSDNQIVALFQEIKDSFKTNTINFRYANIITDIDEFKTAIGPKRSFFATYVNCSIDNSKFTVAFARGLSTFLPANNSINTGVRTPSPYFDEIIVTSNHNGSSINVSIHDIVKIENIIRSHIIIKLPKDIEIAGGSAIDLLQKELSAVTEVHNTLLTDAVELRRQSSQENDARLADLAEKENQSLAAIAAHKETVEQELASQKQALEEKEKELDDRNHMHVRRALRGQITSDIQARVGGALLSPRSRKLGIAIFGLSLICAVASGLFSYLSYGAFGQVLAQPSETLANRDWALLVFGLRTTLAVIASLGFLVYALAWLRRTYDEDVKLNNELQRYALDLNRASWIIETVIEMSSKEGQTPPAKWIDGVTHGMFQSSGNGDESVTPLEALGTLLNVTARAEVGPGGTKLEFDGKNLKKIAKSGES